MRAPQGTTEPDICSGLLSNSQLTLWCRHLPRSISNTQAQGQFKISYCVRRKPSLLVCPMFSILTTMVRFFVGKKSERLYSGFCTSRCSVCYGNAYFYASLPDKINRRLCFQPLHELATEAASKGNAKDTALALKAIGNAGEPASIKRILKFLPTFSPTAASLPSRIHADAVLALRKIARKDPAKVTEIII